VYAPYAPLTAFSGPSPVPQAVLAVDTGLSRARLTVPTPRHCPTSHRYQSSRHHHRRQQCRPRRRCHATATTRAPTSGPAVADHFTRKAVDFDFVNARAVVGRG